MLVCTGCNHLQEIGMKVLGARSSLRRGESGLEYAEIPDARGAAVSGCLLVVNL